MKKHANMWEATKQELPKFIAAAIAGGATLTGYSIYSAIRDAIDRIKENKAFELSEKFFPELKNIPPAFKLGIFEMIRHLNPGLAQNPFVLGSLISRIYAAQYVTPEVLKTLSEAKLVRPKTPIHIL